MKNQSTTAVIALIISIIALVLAWTAFNRSGEDLGVLIEEKVEQSAREIRKEYNELEVNARNGALEAQDEAAEGLYEASVKIDVDGNPAE